MRELPAAGWKWPAMESSWARMEKGTPAAEASQPMLPPRTEAFSSPVCFTSSDGGAAGWKGLLGSNDTSWLSRGSVKKTTPVGPMAGNCG